MIVFRPSEAISRVQQSSLRPTFAAPPGVVSLAMGEPDFPTPEPIAEALRQAIRDGHTHYGDLNGDPELRALIADRAGRLSAEPYGENTVVISHGGSAAITASVLAVVDPGDRVVIPEPTYSLYPDAVRLAGGEPVLVPMTANHHLDFDALTAALPGARMVVLCNPSNPTGAVLPPEDLARLGELLDGTDTLVLVDEAYADLVYGGVPFVSSLSVTSLRDRLIYVNTLSKTYAMTGWRIGYAIAPAEVTTAIRHVHRTFNGSVNAAVQRAALVALQLGPEIAAPMFEAYQERRDFVAKRLAATDLLHGNEPEGAFYAFARYDADLPSTDVTRFLLEEGVAVRAGGEYGPSGHRHIRLSFAASLDTLDEGITRITTALERLRTTGVSSAQA
ncbi:aminotransferase class I/II-fold pyridoxal phosphate-dependent enzyme [Streptomyces sp. SID13726]|uniref:pyridoxal phosphate-dependent aminotransferase n=1 Tax=Streptomyces sp. SID13726 TaxID=2706058 RepID=UPI0013B99CCB|nr:aminotransferase class I/II-fold pyridoxal phosphate-dependent enzyme [Streptomyces sp. SID13726]NEA98576.1 aminotransferase class I/II-fold pyridoxal phosphate-dependent enzyme [Streptomyces sp. SID13726]